jgi:3-hydroxyisobutyrate dehydrogenase-like beta-hydroxyacid dehydrogenase
MGAEVGASLTSVGHKVLWIPEGRSRQTLERAQVAGLTAVSTHDELARLSDVVISIVPPHGALDVAEELAGKAKIFVDCNAVSPETSLEFEGITTSKGSRYVDGGIVGPPPYKSGTTRLYLSGKDAEIVSKLFNETRIEALVLRGGAGAASGFKNCYAAWTKGSDGLLLAILSVARTLGVEEELRTEWSRSKPELQSRLYGAGWAAGRKGWRWVREMEEIAKTFLGAGMPSGFHMAAAEIFERAVRDPDAKKNEGSLDFAITGLVKSKPWSKS